MKLFGFERRFARAILEAFAPSDSTVGLRPRPGEVDFVDALERIGRASTARARLGLRAAILVLTFAPLYTRTGLRTMAGLEPRARAALLDKLLDSPRFVLRELTTLLKLQASIALLSTPSIRARSGYDRRLLPAQLPATTLATRRSAPQPAEVPLEQGVVA